MKTLPRLVQGTDRLFWQEAAVFATTSSRLGYGVSESCKTDETRRDVERGPAWDWTPRRVHQNELWVDAPRARLPRSVYWTFDRTNYEQPTKPQGEKWNSDHPSSRLFLAGVGHCHRSLSSLSSSQPLPAITYGAIFSLRKFHFKDCCRLGTPFGASCRLCDLITCSDHSDIFSCSTVPAKDRTYD